MSSHHPSPGPSSQTVSAKTKQKQHNAIGSGIAAGAEDAKYQAKYKDLKRKVKDVETENDILQFKVLQAKRSIQRMKLERAILYERLSGTPPNTGDGRDRHGAPVHHGGPGGSVDPPSSRHFPSHQDIAEHGPIIDTDRVIPENMVPHERHRVLSGSEPRSAPALDTLNSGAGIPSSHLRSPPALPASARHSSRHAQHMPQHVNPPPGPPEPSSRSSRAQMSPVMRSAHSNASHERHERPSSHSSRHRTRHSSGQSLYQGPPAHPSHYPEDIPIPQHGIHSPPLPERERSRHHDEYPPSHGNGRHSGYGQHTSPTLHTSDVRSSSHRPHNHQRVGPASYINRDDPMYDRQRELDREREWDHEREIRDRERNREYSRNGGDLPGSQILTSPQAAHRPRQSSDRGDMHHTEHGMTSSQIREEQPVYYRDPPAGPGGYSLHSRSGSPGSPGSGIGANERFDREIRRPDSRITYYAVRDEPGNYRRAHPRASNHPSEDLDRDYSRDEPRSVRDHSGGGNNFPASEPGYPHPESRKRGRNDMDVDSDDAGDGESMHYAGGRKHDDRGSKRYQREHLRTMEDAEDVRAGPP